MSHRSYDLALAVTLADLAVVLTLAAPVPGPVRTCIALPLVLLLPGYTLTEAIFAPGEMEGVGRLLFSVGLSLASAALTGLALNLTPWGLRAGAWAVALYLIVLGAGVVAQKRRLRQPIVRGEARRLAGIRQMLLLGPALLLAMGAIAVAAFGALRVRPPDFTELWILPAAQGEENRVRIGIHSRESAATSFRLQVIVAGEVVQDQVDITLSPNQQVEAIVHLPAPQADVEAVEAKLFRREDPDRAYRRVVWWRMSAPVPGSTGRSIGS